MLNNVLMIWKYVIPITFHHILLLLMLSFGLKLLGVIVFVVYAVEHKW